MNKKLRFTPSYRSRRVTFLQATGIWEVELFATLGQSWDLQSRVTELRLSPMCKSC